MTLMLLLWLAHMCATDARILRMGAVTGNGNGNGYGRGSGNGNVNENQVNDETRTLKTLKQSACKWAKNKNEMHFTISEHFSGILSASAFCLYFNLSVQGSYNAFCFCFWFLQRQRQPFAIKCTLNGRLRMQAPKMFKQIGEKCKQICLCQFTIYWRCCCFEIETELETQTETVDRRQLIAVQRLRIRHLQPWLICIFKAAGKFIPVLKGLRERGLLKGFFSQVADADNVKRHVNAS